MKPFKTVIRRDNPCPGCGRLNDSIGGFSQHRPKPGDILICVACRIFLVFNDDFSLRKMTDHEWLSFSPGQRQHFTRMRDQLEKLDIKP